MELYYAAGNTLVENPAQSRPSGLPRPQTPRHSQTVAGAVRSVAETGASLLTIHASGGEAMIRAAAEAAAVPDAPQAARRNRF